MSAAADLPSIWRRSPRAARARRDLAAAVVGVGFPLALLLLSPAATLGVLGAVAAAPAAAVLWRLSRRRRDAERLIAHLRRRQAAAMAANALRAPADGGDAARLAAALEASTAIRMALAAGVGDGPARVLREAGAVLAGAGGAAPVRGSPVAERVDLAPLLAGLSGSITAAVAPGAPDAVRVDRRLLTALLENLASSDVTDPPALVEAAARDEGLTLSIARHTGGAEPLALTDLRRRAARVMGGALWSVLQDEDIVVERPFLPASAVAAAPLRYSAAAS